MAYKREAGKGGLSVRLSDDHMKLFFSYSPDNGNRMSVDDVVSLASQVGVKEAVNLGIVEKVLEQGVSVDEMVIAEGEPRREGRDAIIVYEVDLETPVKPEEVKDGCVDHHQIGRIIQVRKGTVLAQKLPSTPGKSGLTLRREEHLAESRDLDLPAGRNTEVTDDGLTLKASCSGMLELRNGLINISEDFFCSGNIDYSTGDIEFCGNVVIGGDVRPGFRVETDGNIEIGGCIEAAEVISRSGEITVVGGIVGKNKSKVIAAGTVKAGFIQDCIITAGGNVEAGRYILNSEISAEGIVRVVKKEGTIRGGKVLSRNLIRAKVAGSFNKIPTELKVGSQLSGRVLDRLMEMDDRAEELREIIESNRKRIAFLDLLEERVEHLTAEKIAEREELSVKNNRIEEQLRDSKEEKFALITESMRMNQDKQIEIIQSVYPGVSIFINNHEYDVRRELEGSIFKAKRGQVQVEAIN